MLTKRAPPRNLAAEPGLPAGTRLTASVIEPFARKGSSMTVHRVAVVVVAVSALWVAGSMAQAAESDKCLKTCELLEQRCHYSGARVPQCDTNFRVCWDSCQRTGRPTR